jgi:8-oxo-dGTP pyrophosphatase MutT (NUDIX family)
VGAHGCITTRRQADHGDRRAPVDDQMAATIAWVSEGERAKPRRRRGRRRGRRSPGPPEAAAAEAAAESSAPLPGPRPIAVPGPDGPPPGSPAPQKQNDHKPHPHRRKPAGDRGAAEPRRAAERLRTVHETSAGGLVIDGIDGPKDAQVAALIGRTDRRGRLLWSLPKGHIEQGETAEQTAIREVAEETGIHGSVLAALGSIDYWFVTEGRRVHKTVHHYLMRFLDGELSDEDVEVTEVAWVPVRDLPSRLAYADERKLAEVAGRLIDQLQTDGPGSLPPLPHSSPRRRPQTHSRARTARRADESTEPQPGRRANGCGQSP